MARVWRGAERTWGDTGSEEGMQSRGAVMQSMESHSPMHNE